MSQINPNQTSVETSVYSDNPYAPPALTHDVATEAGPPLAGLGQRLAAAIIDGVLLVPVYFLTGVTVYRLAQVSTSVTWTFLLLSAASSLVSIVMISLGWLLINGYLLARFGQTVGKRIIGTQIVDSETNELIPLLPLFLKRWLLIQGIGALPLVGGFFSLINVLMIFRENRRCLHDDVAGSKVIKFQAAAQEQSP